MIVKTLLFQIDRGGTYHRMNDNKYVLFCKGGCGNGAVLKFDNEDDELSMQLVDDNFYPW